MPARCSGMKDSSRRARVRLYVDQDLVTGRQVSLSGSQAHYLSKVMRLVAGDCVRLFNERDGEWLGRIVSSGKNATDLAIEECVRNASSENGPWLAFAPIKKSALDFIIEKASELGVERLLPVDTQFTVVERLNLARLHAQSVEASEQCERMTIPRLDSPIPLSRLLADWPGDRALLFLDERGGGQPLVHAVDRLRLRAAGTQPLHQPGFLVGPEGGFSDDEAEAVASRPFALRVSMGPRILRAETAAIAALACWQALTEDWRTVNGEE
jgi:16S rRNA (uracil1498-N3)-methyltransferase